MVKKSEKKILIPDVNHAHVEKKESPFSSGKSMKVSEKITVLTTIK